MNHAFAAIAAPLLCLAFGVQAQALAPVDNCETIQQQIAERYRAGGVPNATLVVVAASGLASSLASGRVVGSCGNGSRRIVFVGARPTATVAIPAAPAAPAAPARPAPPAPATPPDRIPTECKDGSIVIGPDCDDPRAPRMTGADLAASVELAASSATAPTTVDASASAAAPAPAATATSAATPPAPPASR